MPETAENSRTFNRYLPAITFFSAVSLFTVLFLIPRIPFFQDIGIPYIFDDAIQYVSSARKLFKGTDISSKTTLGYPAFLSLMYRINPNISGVLIAQALLSYLGGMLFLGAIFKFARKLTIPVSIFLGIAMSSIPQVHSESALLTESLYVNIMMAYIAMFIFAFRTKNNLYFSALGILAMLSYMIRPAGIFIFAFVFLTCLFLLWNKYDKRVYAYYLGPLVLLFLINSFILQKGDRIKNESVASRNSSMYIATNGFWETNPAYPKYLNKAIRNSKKLAQPKHVRIIQESWNMDHLKVAFFRHQIATIKEFSKILNKENKNNENYDIVKDYKRVGGDALRKHPKLYAKWVLTWFTHYFRSFDPGNRYSYKFLNSYEEYLGFRIRKYNSSKHNKKGKIYGFFNGPKLKPGEAENLQTLIATKSNHKFANKFSLWSSKIFNHMFWVYTYLLAFLISFIKLLKSRFRDKDSFVIFSILGLPIVMGLIIALVHNSFIRYSFTLSFIYFLGLPFIFYMIDFNKLFLNLKIQSLVVKMKPISRKVKAN